MLLAGRIEILCAQPSLEQWRCNALNEKSRAAARRLGFRFEGIWFSHMIVKGRNRDTAWYSDP